MKNLSRYKSIFLALALGCGGNVGGEGICGDGFLDAGEVCDDGNAFSGDGCRFDCSGIEICGDGVLQGALGEGCDDGNTTPGDGCGPTCLPEVCGNGFLDPGEVCDDGNDLNGDSCSADCQEEFTCGDGVAGTGEFCGFSTQTINVGGPSDDLAIGDLDGDGNLDIVVRNLGESSSGVLFGNGDGTFAPLVAIPDISGPSLAMNSLDLADLDGDGAPDIVGASGINQDIFLLFNNGDGTFNPIQTFGDDPASDAIITDVDGDGLLDIISLISFFDTNEARVFFNEGGGVFGEPLVSTLSQPPDDAVLGDVTGDGNLDLIATIDDLDVDAVVMFTGDGSGVFSGGVVSDASNAGSLTDIAAGDQDGDGLADAAVVGFSGTVFYRGTPTGLQIIESLDEGRFGVALEDINRDGLADLLLGDSTGGLHILLSQPATSSRRFAPPQVFAGDVLRPKLGDFNGDGLLDIAAASSFIQDTNITIFLANPL